MAWMMWRWLSRVGWAMLLPLAAVHGQVHRASSMTSPEVARLDRAKTVVILPGGILEEHGPYLPSFSDGLLREGLADSLAAAIVLRPGWHVVVFPAVPAENSAANDIVARFSYPGTFAVRYETLRSVFMDWGDELGAQGFRWICVVHLHGAPNHNRALDAAGDYFHDTLGGRMVQLAGLMPVLGALDGATSPGDRAADPLPIHAGMDETSLISFLAPTLVHAEVRMAPPQADNTIKGLVRLATRPGWPGYLGAPDRNGEAGPAGYGPTRATHAGGPAGGDRARRLARSALESAACAKRRPRGRRAIAVNDQWRSCFRFEDGDACDVEFCDYHWAQHKLVSVPNTRPLERCPTHPGEMLREEFLPEYELSVTAPAEAAGVARQSMNELLRERRRDSSARSPTLIRFKSHDIACRWPPSYGRRAARASVEIGCSSS